MQLIVSADQIAANVATLEATRHGEHAIDFADYAGLIKRGTCFLPYQAADCIAFAPSRFVGYVGNSLAKHAAKIGRASWRGRV